MQSDILIIRRVRNVSILIAVLLLAPACYLAVDRYLLIYNGTLTQGHVVEVLGRSTSSHRSDPRVQVEFATEAGELIRIVSSVERQVPHDVGQSVEVLYDSRRPHKAILNTNKTLWIGVYSFGVLGCFFLGFAGLMHTGLIGRGA